MASVSGRRALPGIPNHPFHAQIGCVAYQPEAARDAARVGDGFGTLRHNIVRPSRWVGPAPAFPPPAPKWPVAVRLLTMLGPSAALWGLIIAGGGYLAASGAREVSYALSHPRAAVVAEAVR